MDRMVQLMEDIGELKVSVAEVSTTVRMGFESHAEQLKEQAAQLKALNEKTDTALLPIKVAKALASTIGWLSVIGGFFYGIYQFVAVKSGSIH